MPTMFRVPAVVRLAMGLALAAAVPPAPSQAGFPARVRRRPLRGPAGKPVELKAPAGGATALVFYSSECPISNAYSPILNKIAEEFAAGRFKLVGVCVDPELSDAEVEAHARDFGLKFPVARDPRGVVAAKLG